MSCLLKHEKRTSLYRKNPLKIDLTVSKVNVIIFGRNERRNRLKITDFPVTCFPRISSNKSLFYRKKKWDTKNDYFPFVHFTWICVFATYPLESFVMEIETVAHFNVGSSQRKDRIALKCQGLNFRTHHWRVAFFPLSSAIEIKVKW